MLELLILYSLSKQELTLYGLKKYIFQKFGEMSNPSHGALHPALKRLMAKGIISLRKKMSDGGKRYTYYGVASCYAEFFQEKFMQLVSSETETLDAFLTGLRVRFAVIEILDSKFIPEFKEKTILQLNCFDKQLDEKLSNQYLELSDSHKHILEFYKKEITYYIQLVEVQG